MPASFPNSQNRDAYIESLSENYKNNYPDFTKSQLEAPIRYMVIQITDAINLGNSPSGMRVVMQRLKQLGNPDTSFNPFDGYFCIDSYLKENQNTIEWATQEFCEVSFPEKNSKDYVKFAAKVTKQILEDICNATEDAIKKNQQSRPADRVENTQEQLQPVVTVASNGVSSAA